MSNYLGKESPEGELAEDIHRMSSIGILDTRSLSRPSHMQGMRFLRFLKQHGAREETLRTAIHIVREYTRYHRYESTF